MVELLHCINLS